MSDAPEIGTLVVDARRDRVGEVMGTLGGRLMLRAPGGGREWEALPCDVRPAAPNDALRAKVADVNERSRQGRGEVRPRCATCDDIKHRRYRAVDDGDTEEATRMTVAMGVHLREAHPE